MTILVTIVECNIIIVHYTVVSTSRWHKKLCYKAGRGIGGGGALQSYLKSPSSNLL